ncbi:C39 family peptidase [Bradyrhizobium sp. MOS002]|uniref:C39 family peptidase n=1 Tax=Bradyrhizobium sp. MOS002 TaxID=2133947 RepID=UPI0011B21E55|nr:C39 family peptidase [Bradyrhizobium sp. MOS002]
MKKFVLKALMLTFFALGGLSERAAATVLPISPVAQQTPEWCFAASAAMIFEYLGYPNLNQFGNYQCAVVAAQGGPCMANCGMCLNAGGTMQRVALIMQSYAMMAQQFAGYQNASVFLQFRGILSPTEIKHQIDNDGPILAGISPGQIPYPPGLGVSQHAIVVVGYESSPAGFDVVLNDPFPYPGVTNPYLTAGGIMLQPGQYRVAFQTFVGAFHYGNSLTFR